VSFTILLVKMGGIFCVIPASFTCESTSQMFLFYDMWNSLFLPHPNINGKGYGTVPLIPNRLHSLISVNDMVLSWGILFLFTCGTSP
jgi:hypothetical protein